MFTLTTLAFISLSSLTCINAQIPLISQIYPWPYNVPPQVDTSTTARGVQIGINQCNSTTQNQNSLCINAVVNSLSDFCLYAPPSPNSTIADTEGEEVAWCTKSGYGTRILPDSALLGVQAIKTPDYLEIIGAINQPLINIAAGDTGGELDPHGADGRGNPIGALMYSTAFSANGTFEQIIEWNIFLGGNVFCIKVCNPASPNAAQLCLNTYDRIGCAYNMPANYNALNGTFQSCLGDDQLPVGTYVANGITSTYQQPAEGLGPITSIPYTAAIPASSSCTPFSSADLYLAGKSLASVSSASASASSTSVAHTASTSSHPSSKGPSSSSSSSTPKPSGASNNLINLRSLVAVILTTTLGLIISI